MLCCDNLYSERDEPPYVVFDFINTAIALMTLTLH